MSLPLPDVLSAVGLTLDIIGVVLVMQIDFKSMTDAQELDNLDQTNLLEKVLSDDSVTEQKSAAVKDQEDSIEKRMQKQQREIFTTAGTLIIGGFVFQLIGYFIKAV